MKSFFIGLIGAATFGVAAILVASQYADYRSRAQSSQLLVYIRPILYLVEENARKQNTLSGSGRGLAPYLPKSPLYTDLIVTDFGTVIIRGGSEGQVIVLVPEMMHDNITWKCIGGSARDMNLNECKSNSRGSISLPRRN